MFSINVATEQRRTSCIFASRDNIFAGERLWNAFASSLPVVLSTHEGKLQGETLYQSAVTEAHYLLSFPTYVGQFTSKGTLFLLPMATRCWVLSGIEYRCLI